MARNRIDPEVPFYFAPPQHQEAQVIVPVIPTLFQRES